MKYFTLKEFERSNVANAMGIDNSIPVIFQRRIEYLVNNVLDPLREHLGKPITITSGYRCPALNEAIGGVAVSQHMFGEAADIKSPGIKPIKLFNYIKDNCEYDQLILYPTFVHVSFSSRRKNRMQIIKYK